MNPVYRNVSGSVIGRDQLLEHQEATFIHFGLASVSSGVDTTEAEWTFPQSKRETKHSRLPIFCNIFTMFWVFQNHSSKYRLVGLRTLSSGIRLQSDVYGSRWRRVKVHTWLSCGLAMTTASKNSCTSSCSAVKRTCTHTLRSMMELNYQ